MDYIREALPSNQAHYFGTEENARALRAVREIPEIAKHKLRQHGTKNQLVPHLTEVCRASVPGDCKKVLPLPPLALPPPRAHVPPLRLAPDMCRRQTFNGGEICLINDQVLASIAEVSVPT